MSVIIRVLAVLLLLNLASAFPPSASAEEETSDPYGTVRLSRISLIEGEVLLQRGDDEEWVAASVNMPLRPHDKLWATDDARAEVQFDDGTVVRLAENTNLDLLSLEPDWIQLQLTLGVASFAVHVSSRTAAHRPFLEIDTPQATTQVTRSTAFRVDVAEDGSTVITVRDGEVELNRDEEPIVIARNQRVSIEGGDTPRYLLESAQEPDEWDRWTENRDTQRARAEDHEHLPSETEIGVTELYAYGRWDQLSSYGWVWVPQVAVGWVPYHVGRWVWVEPWGWTWVSYEPWGWLPYHYGRWVVVGGMGWVWVPGPTLGIWTPGCVRFFYGPNWVGWVPLGPGEVYYYHPGVSVNININLVNYRVPGAAIVMSRRRFVTGTAEEKRFVPPKDPIRAGRVAVGPPPVVPTRASLHPAPGKAVRADRLPPRMIHRPVVYTRPPSAPPPLFEHRVKEIHGVITQGRPPAAPSLPEKGVPGAEERRAAREKIHKDITVREVITPSRPSAVPKRAPGLPEERAAPSHEAKKMQPSPPKSVKLPRTPSEPSAPQTLEGRTQQVRPLYRMPPQSNPKPGVVLPPQGGGSGGTGR
ncbi:MAG: FecR domain-containing protein [Nitrospirae bacterium]|nr:FecR domain-containing protein [Nitrospirota bacterium]